VLTATLPSRRAAPLRVGIALVAAWCLCMPAQAQTSAGGLGTAVGLGAALLALIVLQGSGGVISPAASLGVVTLALLSIVALSQWRRRRPATARGALLAPASALHGHATLVAEARAQFLALQAAWDGADIAALGALTTEEMLAELVEQLPERGPGTNRTDVLSLQAWVLRVENLGGVEVASIEFSGMVRESVERGPVPFRELWMLARRDAAQPWRLARQQALM
jgi:hypothetical protein